MVNPLGTRIGIAERNLPLRQAQNAAAERIAPARDLLACGSPNHHPARPGV